MPEEKLSEKQQMILDKFLEGPMIQSFPIGLKKTIKILESLEKLGLVKQYDDSTWEEIFSGCYEDRDYAMYEITVKGCKQLGFNIQEAE